MSAVRRNGLRPATTTAGWVESTTLPPERRYSSNPLPRRLLPEAELNQTAYYILPAEMSSE